MFSWWRHENIRYLTIYLVCQCYHKILCSALFSILKENRRVSLYWYQKQRVVLLFFLYSLCWYIDSPFSLDASLFGISSDCRWWCRFFFLRKKWCCFQQIVLPLDNCFEWYVAFPAADGSNGFSSSSACRLLCIVCRRKSATNFCRNEYSERRGMNRHCRKWCCWLVCRSSYIVDGLLIK